MNAINEFCGQKNGYSRSITLRNKLIPIGKTEENLQKLHLLENDKKRAASYHEVKNLIDEFHRSFIQDVLSKTSFEWGPLYDEFDLYQNEKDKEKKNKIKPDLQKLQAVMRNKIVKQFTGDERFKKLFAKELLSELLPEIIKSAAPETVSDKEEALKVFNKFSTYFTGFHENRKNMYSEEEKSTAISYRIVNENFPKFYSNIKLFKYLEENFPQIISDTEESLKEFLNGKKLKDIFNAEAFNNVLSQTGIDFYNTVIGGIADKAGSQKVQGLNEKINLARQQLPDAEKNKLRGKMVVLFKQILSDRETASFIPVGFENNEEVYKTVQQFKKETLDKAVEKIKDTFKSENDYSLDQIYVPAKELTAFSQSIFGHWSILSQGLFTIEEEKSKKELSEAQTEKITKEIAKKDYSLSELQTAYEKYCEKNNEQVCITVKKYFDLMEFKQIEGTSEKEDVMILSNLNTLYASIDFESQKNLQQEKEAATPIKAFLDEVQNLYHYLKLTDYRGEEEKDSAFYSKLEEILLQLDEIIPLYNKVRNFVTKKPGEEKKFKLNFDCPTLADGWALNNETSNACIILRDENKYFLGIMEKTSHKDFKSYPNCNENDNFYEKMIYLQAADPSKDIPNLLVIDGKTVKKNGRKDSDGINRQIEKLRDTYLPQEINSIRKNKSHLRTSETFNKDDLIKYIDYYKERTIEYFNSYNFHFKNSDEYYSFADFTDDVNSQAYQIQFIRVPKSHITSLVNSGKLFLFQIYNKDFAEKTSGKKNLHTLYWENLFSKENLDDVCIKLNGQAELFFRPVNKELKVIKHEKGSILVNRTTSDGKSIPEEIYQEIYQFKNKMISSVSDEAKKLLETGTVVCKEAKHEIIKDRHFTENTYLFHCPITMNFKAPEISGKKFNNRVLEYLKNNPDVKIIGLDRGERHLIYLSLINQKGEIELQKTLNLVEQVRNNKTVSVNYQEKLVQKEGNRDKARKNWQTIGNIKELKEGYLSNIVHEIAKLMVENNAIVVMEDLNFGFKRGRFAVERQVYQKFEQMLIDKLNYLVFKDKNVTEPGGVLNAYQLTDKFTSFKELGKQCGWLFYIPAAYTSKIDPKTGFANLFNLAGLTNFTKKKDFFSRFDSINYNAATDSFAFTFNYEMLCNNADYKKKWTVYSNGERIFYNPKTHSTETVNVTKNIKGIFAGKQINYQSENNVLDSVLEIGADFRDGERPSRDVAIFWDSLFWNFKLILQMRNSIPNSEVDYLISPVMAEDGTFFDSREQKALGKDAKLPVDADANGAYHIALKGLYLLKNNFNLNNKGYIENITNADWFKFVQTKEYLK